MPWHTSALHSRYSVARIVEDVFEVHDPGVVIVLPREQGEGEVRGMDVRNGMIVGVPASKAQIKTSNSSPVVVYHDNLLH